MADFTFLHAADLHLDSPLRGLDADASAERIRRATRDALVNMVDFAREKQVDFVLLVGDLYDGDWRDWRMLAADIRACPNDPCQTWHIQYFMN